MKLITTLSFLLFTLSVYGQQVSGIITDSEGEPLIGVSVMVKETSEGTASDYDGSYSVKAQFGQTLVYSYVGYEAQEIPVDNRTQIDVQLKSDAELLDEVVVIGYGVKKQRDVIGSVSKVGAEDLTQTQNASFVAGLQGRASGVQVTQSSGVPGAPSSIKIRGVNSLSIGTDPLWIIDGIPIYSGSGLESTNGATRQDPMSLINPNDIESIEILKDAAATAIYGSRGSNGVIIITTKSGKKGKGTINVNYTGGITDLSRTPEDIGFANTTQWFDLVETARRNSNGGVDAPFDPNTTLNLFQDDPIARLTRDEAMAVNTNWFDQILRTGSFHDVGLSASQGFEKGSFFVSANYRNDQSVLRNNELERYTARANVEFRPIESFSIETRINLSYTQNDRVKGQAGGATGNNGGGNSAGFGNANRTALPWYPIFNSSHPSGYWNPMSGANLTAAIDRDLLIDEVQNYRGIASIALNYDLPWIKGLQLRSEGSIDYLNTQGLNWITATLREDGSFAADENNRRQSLNY
ncbi:MAG: SusC/RagA family TonB-linked outer membrane protein, partial [Bacteroidota bacterium]